MGGFVRMEEGRRGRGGGGGCQTGSRDPTPPGAWRLWAWRVARCDGTLAASFVPQPAEGRKGGGERGRGVSGDCDWVTVGWPTA